MTLQETSLQQSLYKLNISLVTALEGPNENVAVYRITNTTKKTIVLTTSPIKNSADSWVFLSSHELKYREQTLCIVSSKRTGK